MIRRPHACPVCRKRVTVRRYPGHGDYVPITCSRSCSTRFVWRTRTDRFVAPIRTCKGCGKKYPLTIQQASDERCKRTRWRPTYCSRVCFAKNTLKWTSERERRREAKRRYRRNLHARGFTSTGKRISKISKARQRCARSRYVAPTVR